MLFPLFQLFCVFYVYSGFVTFLFLGVGIVGFESRAGFTLGLLVHTWCSIVVTSDLCWKFFSRLTFSSVP